MSTCPKRAVARALAATAFALSAAGTANAAYVLADLTRVGGNTWDASFTVGEDPGQTVEAFSIYFDWTQVSNLLVLASPTDWDSLAIQADSALAADGYFDALVMVPGVSAGTALGGFSARFDWADPAGPSALWFTISDPSDFSTIEWGSVQATLVGPPSLINEPLTSALAALGVFAASATRRRGRSLASA